MKIFDLVRPKDPNAGRLRSGCQAYSFAVVVSVEPFILISAGGDTIWFHQKAQDYEAIGVVSGTIQEAVRKRCARDGISIHEVSSS